MGLKGLKETPLKLILFGGKGGVGKTTCACGTALYLAKDFKTLILSTDPAHSLADSLGQKLGYQPKEIKAIKNLSALEVNAEKALSKFKTEHGNEIKKIVETGTNLDTEDIDSVFALPIPGMDEVMGFKTMVDLVDEAKFDKYIVDTAPTGHALRLLTSPRLLDDWVKVMAKMCEFCREKKKEQDKYINQIRVKFNGLKTTVISSRPREIKGIEALANFKEQLFD